MRSYYRNNLETIFGLAIVAGALTFVGAGVGLFFLR